MIYSAAEAPGRAQHRLRAGADPAAVRHARDLPGAGVVATVWSDAFLTKGNILNVLRQVASGAGIMAVGMLFVILTRGIDLSVGSIAALGSVLTGHFVALSGYGTIPTILLVILAGGACGLFTGGVRRLPAPAVLRDVARHAGDRARPGPDHLGRAADPAGRGRRRLQSFGSGFLSASRSRCS